MLKNDYLLEIGCEELPTSAMLKLSHALQKNIETNLAEKELAFDAVESYTSPRRLAIIVKQLDTEQTSKTIERRGPSTKAAFDKDGTPTLACLGFASSCGVTADQLQTLKTDKGEWIFCKIEQPGQKTSALLPNIVQSAVQKLPVPKPMRWGNHDYKFIRPVHWVVSLFGEEIVDVNLFELKSQSQTFGHRFHHPAAIKLTRPQEYFERLFKFGKVMPKFTKRMQYIKDQIHIATEKLGFHAVLDEELLTEVTTLVEWPVILVGRFAESFLKVPQEALITAMQVHQKSFAIVDDKNKLQPYFIIVSNIESKEPKVIIKGNERVINARLSDAMFFYEQDLKNSLSSKLQQLEQVVFQKDLGSLANKSERISELAKYIAKQLDADQQQAARAGLICKCDLLSEMVYEFPELQGIMGHHYALHDDEGDTIASAIKEHYMPRFAGDNLPADNIGAAVALADKIDTLIGIIGINKLPKGDKDPFALRRAALGIVRILIEKQLDLDLKLLLKTACKNYSTKLANKDCVDQALSFILDRLKTWCHDNDISVQIYNAIHEKNISNLHDFNLRAIALKNFMALEEASALAAANKRVNNILKKNDIGEKNKILKSLLSDEAEKALVEHIDRDLNKLKSLFEQRDYQSALSELAHFKTPVDNFFDKVMVMCDDKKQRSNRLAIIKELQGLFTMIADLSQLQQ